MLISSVNSAGLEGRSTISPALRHRSVTPRVKSLREYETADLAKIIQHWILKRPKITFDDNLLDNACNNIAQDFQKCLQKPDGKNLNLRILRKKLDKILPSYLEIKIDPEKIKIPQTSSNDRGSDTDISIQIDSKIFLNTSNPSSEKLSAVEVALLKTGNNKNLKGENLNYAAESVLSKALLAKENKDENPRTELDQKAWDSQGKSGSWYKRYNRTDFKKVDLRDSFRSVFVNCKFDDNFLFFLKR